MLLICFWPVRTTKEAVTALLKEQWAALDEAGKVPWEDKAVADQARYAKELEAAAADGNGAPAPATADA